MSAVDSVPPAARVSVVVPVYAGGDDFRRCLASLAALDPPADEVVVVVDGGGADDVAAATAAGFRVLQTARRGGPGRARNQGVAAATGDVVLFLDADVTAHTDAVDRVRDTFRRHPGIAAVIGSYDDEPGATNFLSQYKNLVHHFTHQSARAEAFTFWSGCGAVSRDVFLRHGGFDEAYDRPSIEDIELGYRLRAAGERIRLDTSLQVSHLKRWTPRSLITTDVRQRALPWSALILRSGRLDNDLNVGLAGRAGVLLAGLLAVALPASLRSRGARPLALGAAGALVGVDWPLLSFLGRHRGPAFAATAALWQWLYHLYSGVAFAVALVRHVAAGRGPAASTAASPPPDESAP